jgi:5-aminopentanamidase
MKIALASPPFPKSISDGLYWVDRLAREAKEKNAEIICFPESYIPGYPGLTEKQEAASTDQLRTALKKVCGIAAENDIAIIIPMDWYHPDGLWNIAHVISNTGEVLGYQTKNQLDPSEDHLWIPGTERRIFELKGLKFGITICHEGFRYPESVRWSAQRDAQIVFHPQCTGNNTDGVQLRNWGDAQNPYYEKAMMMRAMENTIYFASSNYAFRFPDSASSVIDPNGICIAHEKYGNVGVIVADIDPGLATGLLAKRYRPALNA